MIIQVKEMLIMLIVAIDEVNVILKNHHRLAAVLAYQLGQTMKLSQEDLSVLTLAAAMHDIGALTVKDSDQLLQLDVLDPEPHAAMGAAMLSHCDWLKPMAQVIRYHHLSYKTFQEHKQELDSIYPLARILHVADRVAVLMDSNVQLLPQVDGIRDQIGRLSGNLLDPEVVRVFDQLAQTENFWFVVDDMPMSVLLNEIPWKSQWSKADFASIEPFLMTISHIIDFKSPYTAAHSVAVAHVAYAIAHLHMLPENLCQKIKMAGFLHDIGKIAVPTELIEKPSPLEPEEYQMMKAHAYYTRKILSSLSHFSDVTHWAASHHERRDGTGYPIHLMDTGFSIEMAIIAYADVFTALLESRPYRPALALKEALLVLEREYANLLQPDVFQVINRNGIYLNRVRMQAQKKACEHYAQKL